MKHLVFILSTLLLIGVLALSGCPLTDNGEGGEDENILCDDEWVRTEGVNGRLYQEVEITFIVPDDYDGYTNPYMIGSAFTKNPEVPVMSAPPLTGEGDQSAELIPGESYTYTSDYHDRCSVCRELTCGEYFHLALFIYSPELNFPADIDWLYMSEEQYQVGGDPIVVGPVDLVRNTAQ